ncbi:hypothetical protein M422DRAFT_81320, partial [Sphaerobolus stellatus SS14]
NMDERLDLLLAHITSAVSVIKSEYSRKGQTIPSLDSPDIRPFDLEEPSNALSDAMKTVDAACEELVATVVNPYRRMADVVKRGCICTVIDAKVPTHLKNAGEKGLAVEALSEKTGITSDKLSRVLRYLSTKHIFREGMFEPGVFVNNQYSMLLHENTPISAAISCNEEGGQASARLSEVLRHPIYGFQMIPGLAALEEFSMYPKARAIIRGLILMLILPLLAISLSISAYPWASLPSNTTIVDVGGRIGAGSLKLYKSFPNLRFIIQDLPGPFWSENYPEALESGRVSFETCSFAWYRKLYFKALFLRSYELKTIRHNWKDDDSVKILTNVRRSMGRDSKLLLR